jgi:hypothetical protein
MIFTSRAGDIDVGPLELIKNGNRENGQVAQWNLVFIFSSEVTQHSWGKTMYCRHSGDFYGWWNHS